MRRVSGAFPLLKFLFDCTSLQNSRIWRLCGGSKVNLIISKVQSLKATFTSKKLTYFLEKKLSLSFTIQHSAKFLFFFIFQTYTPTGFEKYSTKSKIGEYSVVFSIWDTSGKCFSSYLFH